MGFIDSLTYVSNMALHGTFDLILQKANLSLLVVLIPLSVEYTSMVNQYIGSTK